MSETFRWLLIIALVVIAVAVRWFPFSAFADDPDHPSALTWLVLPGCLFAAAFLLAFVRRRS
jgi:branched-subunit amino acid transport protein AzlD